MSDLPVLYSFRRCPYAIRARMALHYAGVQCEVREVSLKSKPEQMLAISPKGTVPVLQLADGTVIEESLEIMRWALKQYDPDNWWSDQPDLQEEVLALVAQNDGAFKYHLDRYKYPERFGANPDAHFAEARNLLVDLDVRLQATPFLMGESVSLADVALFPFVRQFAATDRERFDNSGLSALVCWLEYWLADARFSAIMQKMLPWQESDAVRLLIRH